MNTKGALTVLQRALDMRNHSLWTPATTPMLRSTLQLRLSSEIELFEDRIDPLAGTSGIPGQPGRGGVGVAGFKNANL